MKSAPRLGRTWSCAPSPGPREDQAKAPGRRQGQPGGRAGRDRQAARHRHHPQPGARLCAARPGHHHPADGARWTSAAALPWRPARDRRGAARPGLLPRLGQMLDVETGLIRFNGTYNNPSLDILALRPNISVRAQVQVTGSAQAPASRCTPTRNRPMPKSFRRWCWAAMLRPEAPSNRAATNRAGAAGPQRRPKPHGQRRQPPGPGRNRLRGATTGEDASAAAPHLRQAPVQRPGVTYEQPVRHAGHAVHLYDLSRRLTLRGQTGEKSAVDIIYTVKYDWRRTNGRGGTRAPLQCAAALLLRSSMDRTEAS